MFRLLSSLISLVLIVLVLYSLWQVSQLRHEVADLRVQVAALKARSHGGTASASQLDQAWAHIEKARRLLLKGEAERARMELSKGLRLLQQAGRDVSAGPRDTIGNVQRTVGGMRSTIDRIWKQLGGKPEPAAKGG